VQASAAARLDVLTIRLSLEVIPMPSTRARANVGALAMVAATLIVVDPYSAGLVGGDLLPDAEGVPWQTILAVVDFAMLVGVVVAAWSLSMRRALQLQFSELALFLATNTYYLYRDGVLRFGNGSGAMWPILLLLAIGFTARLACCRMLRMSS
jgi:hypothetical protein